MFTKTLQDEKATRLIGSLLGENLKEGTVLLLEGDLGAGKTTLIQGIGQGLGITEPVVSPTFILLNEYTEGRIPLYHFDLYRLSNQEVKTISPEIYWEGIEVPPGITAIEWADRLPYLPDNYVHIQLKPTKEGRKIIITPIGKSDPSITAILESFQDNASD